MTYDNISDGDNRLTSETADFDQSRNPASPRPPQGGDTPFHLRPHKSAQNPVLTEGDFTVSDGTNVVTVADPFVVKADGEYIYFYEGSNKNGVQELYWGKSQTGPTINHQGLVDPFDTTTGGWSYPLTFWYDDTWYMIPNGEDNGSGSIQVYTATDSEFPGTWSKELELTFNAENVSDTTVFEYDGVWYCYYQGGNGNIQLYYTEGVFPAQGNWTEHPNSPIIGSSANLRPGGRPFVSRDYVDLPMQLVGSVYGRQVEVHRLTNLSPSTSTLTEIPSSPVITGAGSDTNPSKWDWKSHHVDYVTDGWNNIDLAIMDGGQGDNSDWSVGFYEGSSGPFSHFTARPGADVSVAANTSGVLLPLGEKYIDYGRNGDISNDQYIVPADGPYDVSAHLGLENAVEGRFTVDIVSGSRGRISRRNCSVGGGDGFSSAVHPSTTLWLNSGETIHVEMWNATSSSMTVASNSQTRFMISPK
jgi:hypothetical protein